MVIEETDIQGKQLPNIPEEIVEDILKRLPVKSLVRFSCTCKQWRSLIFSDPKFNKSHLDHAKRPSWKVPDVSFDSQFGRSIDCDCNIGTFSSKETISSYFNGRPFPLGSCNGLLFIKGNDKSDRRIERYVLWNPYTNSIKKMENINERIERERSSYVMTGLSYDRASDDYKAIIVVSNRKYFEDVAPFSPYVYSLARNSWKKLPGFTDDRTDWGYDYTGVTLDNGICHWQIERSGSRLICFDPVLDKFKEVGLPDELSGQTYRIGALDGCLSLVCEKSVWVMKEDECWRELYVLRLRSILHHRLVTTFLPIGYNSSKEEMVVIACGEGIGCWRIANVKTCVASRYPSDNEVSKIILGYNFVPYTESLLCPWLHTPKSTS